MQKSAPPLENTTCFCKLKSPKPEEFLMQKSGCFQTHWRCLEHHRALLPVAFPADVRSPCPGNRGVQGWAARLGEGYGRNLVEMSSSNIRFKKDSFPSSLAP